jgi:hypothetical protein
VFDGNYIQHPPLNPLPSREGVIFLTFMPEALGSGFLKVMWRALWTRKKEVIDDFGAVVRRGDSEVKKPVKTEKPVRRKKGGLQ